MKFNMPNIDKLRADSTSNFGKIDYSNIKPVPIVPNQQKQIELMTDMVNKQSEIIKQQAELISLVQEEALAAAKQARLAMILTLIGLVTRSDSAVCIYHRLFLFQIRIFDRLVI